MDPARTVGESEGAMADELNVVLVDDSQAVIARQQTLLGGIDGVQVVGTAGSGAEALRVVNEARPHLVLMDIVMPDMDGLAALRILRVRSPEVRVAMVSSAGGSERRAEEAFRLGAVQVLAKPVDREQLEALIERERAEIQGDAS